MLAMQRVLSNHKVEVNFDFAWMQSHTGHLDSNSLLQAYVQPGADSRESSTSLKPKGYLLSSPSYHKKHAKQGLMVQKSYNELEWASSGPKHNFSIIQTGGGEENLCMNGHFVPEFMLIGVVKAATTSFAADLRQSPGLIWPLRHVGFKQCETAPCNRMTAKDGRFFDLFYSEGPTYLEQSFPKCRKDVRLVATDQSPTYFTSRGVPERISQVYGPWKSKLKLVVMLREPAERFHSDYWHARIGGFCSHFRNMDFQAVVNSTLQIPHWWQYVEKNTSSCSKRLKASFYGRAFKHWFTAFDPKQFVIVPYLFNVEPGKDGRPSYTVVENMWDRLHVNHGMTSKGVTRFNRQPHPRLNADIDHQILRTFRARLYEKSGPNLLARFFVSHPGAWLYGYNGDLHHTKPIADWIRNNW